MSANSKTILKKLKMKLDKAYKDKKVALNNVEHANQELLTAKTELNKVEGLHANAENKVLSAIHTAQNVTLVNKLGQIITKAKDEVKDRMANRDKKRDELVEAIAVYEELNRAYIFAKSKNFTRRVSSRLTKGRTPSRYKD